MKKIKTFMLFDKNDINIGLEPENTVIFLNRLLANHFVLFLKIWNFHWNIDGAKFNDAHKFFNELYDTHFENIDEISERIRSLGGRPNGTLKSFLKDSEIEEYDDLKPVPDTNKMYEILLEDYEFIIRELRNFLAGKVDEGTTNFLEDLIMKKEKDAWKIRSNIE